jgi:hypothetical protein
LIEKYRKEKIMCLENIKTEKAEMSEICSNINKEGLVEAYKVFYHKEIEKNCVQIVSPYWESFFWKRGWACSYRKDPKLTLEELKYKCTYTHGFYVFLNKSDAMTEAKDFWQNNQGQPIQGQPNPYFVRKVWFKPEHLVCGGTYTNGATRDAECAMVTKLYARFD